MRALRSVVLATVAAGAAAYAPIIVGPYYTMSVRLANGEPVRCMVNQPVHLPSPPLEPPTMRERNEVEVLAAQLLWMRTGPRLSYPTVYTTSDVRYFTLPRSGDQVTPVR